MRLALLVCVLALVSSKSKPKVPKELFTGTQEELEAIIFNSNATAHKIESDLGCLSHYRSEGRKPYRADEWLHLRQLYHQVVPDNELAKNMTQGGMQVSFRIERWPKKGLAIIAQEFIPKGTIVWTSQHQSAHFHTGAAFRTYLAKLDAKTVCDVLHWAYISILDDDRPRASSRITIDLDEGSMMNSGVGFWHPSNAAFDDLQIKAIRNIRKGDEILIDYGDFAVGEGWKWFGL